MNCQECQENISSLIDGELEKKQYQTILAHLIKCKNCFAEFQSLLNLQKTVKEHSSVIMPDEDLWDKIASQLKPRKGIFASLKSFFKIFSMQPVFLKRVEVALVAFFALFAFLYLTNCQIIINKQEISLRFKDYYTGYMNMSETTHENLTRRELIRLIHELRKAEDRTYQEQYDALDENKKDDDFYFQKELNEEQEDNTQNSGKKYL